MTATEIRKNARESLTGKWGKAAGIVLAYSAFSILIGLVQTLLTTLVPVLSALISLAATVISIPLAFGLIISFIKLKRDEEVKAFGFIKDGFSVFSKSWGITFNVFIRVLLPMVCFILIMILMAILMAFGTNSIIILILSIILYIATLIYTVSRALLYSISYYIAYDNPELSSKECVLKSADLMKGNRGNYFVLTLSFIGWAILAAFTFGIGYFWLLPYIQVAIICFYEKIAK